MSPLRTIRAWPTLLVLVALSLGACSDTGTGPAENAAAGSPAATSPGQISAAVVSSLADLQSYTRFIVTLAAAKSPALCLLDGGYYKLRAFTHAGIPFYPTSSQSAEWVYFRANFYEQAPSNPEKLLGSSGWFRTYLGPGQTSSTSWYYGVQWNSWQTDMLVAPDYGANFRVTYEYWWYQNGTWVTQQVVPANLTADSRSPFQSMGSTCKLGYPTSGQALAATSNTGVVLTQLRNMTFP